MTWHSRVTWRSLLGGCTVNDTSALAALLEEQHKQR